MTPQHLPVPPAQLPTHKPLKEQRQSKEVKPKITSDTEHVEERKPKPSINETTFVVCSPEREKAFIVSKPDQKTEQKSAQDERKWLGCDWGLRESHVQDPANENVSPSGPGLGPRDQRLEAAAIPEQRTRTMSTPGRKPRGSKAQEWTVRRKEPTQDLAKPKGKAHGSPRSQTRTLVPKPHWDP